MFDSVCPSWPENAFWPDMAILPEIVCWPEIAFWPEWQSIRIEIICFFLARNGFSDRNGFLARNGFFPYFFRFSMDLKTVPFCPIFNQPADYKQHPITYFNPFAFKSR